jgi:hypothetical protein
MFFQPQDVYSITLLAAVRSLVRQLLAEVDARHLQDLHDVCLASDAQLKVEDFWLALQTIIGHLEQDHEVVLVVDALNESGQIEDFTQQLLALRGCNILVSSQQPPPKQHKVSDSMVMVMNDDLIASHTRGYVEDVLRNDMRFGKCSAERLELVLDTVAHKCKNRSVSGNRTSFD